MSAVWSFDAIGTAWEIETANPLDEQVRTRVREQIELFDEAWSRFRPDSRVSSLAREGGTIAAPIDASLLLDTLGEVSTATADAVNPLIGRSLDALGYDAGLSLRAGAPEPAPSEWRSRLSWTDEALTLSAPDTIDVGALGKGRLVDRVLGVVGSQVDGDVVVDGSGDLAVRGASVRIGLEHPFDPKRAIGVWQIQDEALCASATNRRSWGDGLHHVLDARTGIPVRTVIATWAVAPDALHADAASTALFFDGGAELCHAWGVSWVRMLSHGQVEYSPGCTAELFVRGSAVRS